ncbi:Uncharacterized protein TCM_005073 [Theobroma cacao]|uniref:Uncharacterized protein n=1 Tax=Theobroma cacao TaxID=3641 RepID=A0A061DU86_THECC|nr:Uncharacterized protein TCM_005073 [Theobroma cacao]
MLAVFPEICLNLLYPLAKADEVVNSEWGSIFCGISGSSPSFARLILNASAFWYAWPHMGTTAEYLFPKIFLLKELIGALSHGILAISSNAFSQREDPIGVVNSLLPSDQASFPPIIASIRHSVAKARF